MDEDNFQPWDEFLKARTRCILWLSENRKASDDEIAYQLSMDERQVCLIREYAQTDRESTPKIALGRNDFPISNKSTQFPNG